MKKLVELSDIPTAGGIDALFGKDAPHLGHMPAESRLTMVPSDFILPRGWAGPMRW